MNRPLVLFVKPFSNDVPSWVFSKHASLVTTQALFLEKIHHALGEVERDPVSRQKPKTNTVDPKALSQFYIRIALPSEYDLIETNRRRCRSCPIDERVCLDTPMMLQRLKKQPRLKVTIPIMSSID